MFENIKLAVVLFLVSALAGVVIVFTYEQTFDMVEKIKMDKLERSLYPLFPDGVTLVQENDSDHLDISYWTAKKNGIVAGYAFSGVAAGNGGEIKFVVGLDPDGTILGLKIISQAEAPGLGARMEEVVSQKSIWSGLKPGKQNPEPWFTAQFKGINVFKPIAIDKSEEWYCLSDKRKRELSVENTVTAITGATVSTKAVNNGIKQCAANYLGKLKEIENTRKILQIASSDTVVVSKDSLMVSDTMNDNIHVSQGSGDIIKKQSSSAKNDKEKSGSDKKNKKNTKKKKPRDTIGLLQYHYETTFVSNLQTLERVQAMLKRIPNA